MQGKLLVVTPDSQHTFIVKGRQPASSPPSRTRASAFYLTAGTASSMAKTSRSQSPAGAGPSAVSNRRAAGAVGGGGWCSRGCQQWQRAPPERTTGTQRMTYIQQNIKAAAGSRAKGGSNESSTTTARFEGDGRGGGGSGSKPRQ